MSMVKRLSVTVALALVLGGCSAQTPEVATVAAMPENDAGQLALALAEADVADNAGDAQALTEAVRRIDQLGGRPDQNQSEESQPDDPVPGWRMQVGDQLPPMRGRALGPAYRRGSLGPNRTARIEQLFLAGQKAQIALESAGGRAVALAVFNDKDEQVCAGQGTARRCQWIPIFTQRYRIEITNRDDSAQRYYLVID